MDDDIEVTDATDGEPVTTQAPAPGPDVASIVAQTTEALFAKLAPMLQPQQPAQPTARARPRDRLLGAFKSSMGIDDDDEADALARASAVDLLGDEWGDDAAVRKAVQDRVAGARPLEAVAAMRREQREWMAKIDARFAEQENAVKRATEADAYKRMAQSGQLSEKFPHLFRKGQPSQAALKIFDKFHDVEQLRSALEVAEELAAEMQPRRPQIGSTPGGRATQAPKPAKFFNGSDYDAQVRRVLEEMN